MKSYFITGTDTNVGKTYVTCELLRYFKAQGKVALGMKPVASGCYQTPQGLRNQDACELQAASSKMLPYELINPFVYEPAIAPHIAASLVGQTLTVAQLQQSYLKFKSQNQEVSLIEGAGGWLVPLNTRETLADFVSTAQLEVILVVGMRLGCLNHALLTVSAIQASGVKLAGWVANSLEFNMPNYAENLTTLKNFIAAPCLGVVNYAACFTPLVKF